MNPNLPMPREQREIERRALEFKWEMVLLGHFMFGGGVGGCWMTTNLAQPPTTPSKRENRGEGVDFEGEVDLPNSIFSIHTR